MATTEQLAQALSEVRQQLAEAQRLTMEAHRAGSQFHSGILRTSGPACDEQVSDLLGTLHRREGVLLHLRVCGRHGQPRTSDGRSLQGSGRETACRPLPRDEAQCKTAILSPGEHGQRQDVGLRQKRRERRRNYSGETHQSRVPARRSWTTHCDTHGSLTAWMGHSQHGEHIPGSTDRVGRTFSCGMKIAVLASHAPESIRNVVRLAAGAANGKYQVVRQNISKFLQFGRIVDKDGRGVESEANNTGPVPMDVDSVGKGKGKGKGCFVCGRPGHAAKDYRLNQGKGKGQANGKGKGTPDKNSPAKFEGECRHGGKKGHKWADYGTRLAEAKNKKVHAVKAEETPSTATVAAVEDTGELMKRVGPTMALTLLRHRSSVWKTTTCRQTLSSFRLTALVKSTPVHGVFLPVVTTWDPRTCS